MSGLLRASAGSQGGVPRCVEASWGYGSGCAGASTWGGEWPPQAPGTTAPAGHGCAGGRGLSRGASLSFLATSPQILMECWWQGRGEGRREADHVRDSWSDCGRCRWPLYGHSHGLRPGVAGSPGDRRLGENWGPRLGVQGKSCLPRGLGGILKGPWAVHEVSDKSLGPPRSPAARHTWAKMPQLPSHRGQCLP